MVFMIQYLVIFTQTYSFQVSDSNEKFLTLPVLKNHILTNRPPFKQGYFYYCNIQNRFTALIKHHNTQSFRSLYSSPNIIGMVL